MDERAAFYAAIEADQQDWGLYLIFADWLRDRGEDELADGFAAMGRLRVRVTWSGHRSNYTGLIDLPGDGRVRRDRDGYDTSNHVSRAWYTVAFDAWVRHPENQRGWPSYGECLDNAALAYSRLTQEQKAEAERLLGPTTTTERE